VTRAIVTGALGRATWEWLSSESSPSYARLLQRWLSNTLAGLDDDYADAAPAGQPWAEVLPGVLADALRSALEKGGTDPAAWRWDTHHRTRAVHALSPAFPGLETALDPPSAHVGGDADTLQCAGFGWSGKADFNITVLSVYRQVVDFADPGSASYIVPGGVSGLPATPHYADQLAHWRDHERVPMFPSKGDIRHELTLRVEG
jgi:penicillin G amidase